MNTVIDVHAVQTVPPSNINRDDTGSPKTAVYGGVMRARASSQAWKRVTRERFNRDLDPSQVGTRTKDIVAALRDRISERHPELTERSEALATAVFETAGFKLSTPKVAKGDAPKPAQSGYLMFLSATQLSHLADQAAEAAAFDDPKKALKRAEVRSAADRDHSIDIALFGRMVADAPELNVDAACQVAHALGVHAVTPEYDYFTAVDDLTGDDESGAGMIGTVEFYSTTFYRYATINVDKLIDNLGDTHAAQLAVEAFVHAFLESMPTGKQNTFANGTLPDAALVTVRRGQGTNFVGAFEEPIVSKGGFVKPAVTALAEYAAEMHTAWGTPTAVYVAGRPSISEPLLPLGTSVSFTDLGATAAAHVPGVEDS